ncbi:site-2 protease family protein [Aeromicrobium sp. NPDC092404]|uniref:site-2 protease family protein n=1 Tax=Aeromicrobium sp. NPDC092404 TaxID=3154976 RepID=UPI003445D47B
MSSTQHPGAWRLGRLVGVDVLIKPSLLVMGAALILLFAPRFDDRTDANPYVLALAFVLALYVSVLIHELAHVAVARGFRMRVHSVTLHLLGGETLIEGESRTPWQELAVSIAGPLSSFAIGLVCFAVEPSLNGTPADVMYAVAQVNILVAIFNMLPGLPLDGGRVFRAVIWQVTGREETGIRIAAWFGRVTAVAIVAYALTRAGEPSFEIDVAIAVLVGFFLWQGAGDALANAGRSARINALVAREIGFPGATPPPNAEQLSADLHGAHLLKAMAARPAEAYALMEQDGTVYGVLTARAVDEAYRAGRR